MKCKYLPLTVFLLLSITGFAHEWDSIRLETKRGNQFIIHQVDPGETVYSLAKRYDVDPRDISRINRLIDNDIKIGQFLEIPYGSFEIEGKTHTVRQGESLYSISRRYGVSVEDIRRWNRLRSNAISVGQELIIEGKEVSNDEIKTVAEVDSEEPVPNYDHYVQTGETIESIADKFNTTTDSIKKWNGLASEDLEIGQKLSLPFEIDEDSLAKVTKLDGYKTTRYGSKMRSKGEGGITEVFEEGVARKIDTQIETDKYLALHRNLRMGSVMQVKNLMNNKTIYVRVVGKLPDTGLNDNVMVRLTPIAFDRLGIVDDKALVEINYFRD